MTTISGAVETARENARGTDGRFGQQHHSDPGQVGLGGGQASLDYLGLAPGQTLDVPEAEHGDPDLGTVRIGRDADGTFWAEGGPDLDLDATAPFGADEREYLDRNFHRVAAHLHRMYGARADLADPDDPRRVRAVFRTRLDSRPDTSQVRDRLHEHTGLDDLVEDVADRPGTRYGSYLEAALREQFALADEAAVHPRDAVAPGGAAYSQAQLDWAVSVARQNIPIQQATTRPQYRSGYTICAYTHPRGQVTLHVHDSSAWRQPDTPPLLPWSPPPGIPVATVDLDGHADLVDRPARTPA